MDSKETIKQRLDAFTFIAKRGAFFLDLPFNG